MIITKYAMGCSFWYINGEGPHKWSLGKPDWSEVPEIFDPCRDTSVTV